MILLIHTSQHSKTLITAIFYTFPFQQTSYTTRFPSLSLSSRQGRQKDHDGHESRLEDLTAGLDFLVGMIYQIGEHILFSYLDKYVLN